MKTSGTSSKDKENEKFWEGMFAYKTTCEEDSNMKNLLKENPDWDDDTRKCCTRIYVNNCFEKQYGLKHVLPLEPIIDNRCLNHLRDTQTNCKINTR